jgi:hypothetical protein
MSIQVYNNLSINGSVILAKNETQFPTNPSLGTLLVKDQCLYAYINIGGVETWYPFASRTQSYIHTQGLAALTWTVTHNLNTTDIWYQVQDPDGHLIIVNKTNATANTFDLEFTYPALGTVVVVAPDSVEVPIVKSSLLKVGGNDEVVIDTTGVKINGAYALTTASIDDEITARANADTTLQSNINTEITARTNTDTTLQNNINSEITARANADTTLQDNLNTEITARTNANTTLQANINTEITARTNANTTLQSAINSKQTLDPDLTAIAELAGTSGFLKKTATNTWELDTNIARAVPYDISGQVIGKPENGATVMYFISPRSFSIPSGLSGSIARCATNASASTVLTLFKNGVSFGTITFASGSANATLASASGSSFASGDVLTVVNQAVADTTLANIGFTIAATIV